MSEEYQIAVPDRPFSIQNQLQWLNWKCDELYRKQKDCEASTNLVRKSSAALLEQEIRMLQHIGQTLEAALNLGTILKRFEP
jgi:hypothetical protein